jgi:hypothetical protein
MSLRSTLTRLASSLSFPRVRVTWVAAAAALGLTASATGCGGCGDNSLQPCPSNVGQPGMYCICDGLGCRVATLQGNGGSDGGVVTGSGGTTGTGGGATTTTTTVCDPSQAACPCLNGACPGGLSCVNDLCIVGCNFTYECGAGFVCDNGACVAGCDATHTCAAGYTCTNGACALDPANPQCSTSNPCPTGQICASGVCAASCTTNNQCGSDEVCDGTTGSCIPNPSTKPVCSTAEPCPTGEQCLSDGFCHYPCTTTADCEVHDNRFTCSNGYCKTQQEIDPQCTLTMPCPDAGTCISNTCF